MGSLYKQKSRDGKPGGIWWIKYYLNGKPLRESTKVTKKLDARRILKEREGRIASGQPVLPRADRVRYDEVATDLLQHYKTTGSRDLVELKGRLAHLDPFFDGRRIAAVSQADVISYILKRQTQSASNGTINRELGVLIRIFKLAYECGKLFRPPVIRKLRERGPRQGFFELEQYQKIRRLLPADLRLAVTIAYTFGWRMQSEVLALERRQLDLKAGTLRLEPGTTKNDEGRLVYLTPELKTLLQAQVHRVAAAERQTGAIIPFVFPHLNGKFRGKRRRDFRKAWATACKRAAVIGMLRHDFRRTAVRNMVNKGVSERVAMKVTGHKTRSVFDRYHIVSPADLQDATRRLSGITTGITDAKERKSRR